ncbi:hypothetical protein GCM10023195_16830 [Actinoallomurus liliacearum]|uniref:Secreted protein n=1 Tax=Actinoallomurus liliacearum TaxID=1080073 RepID=A0ABP8TCZ5_9ACTN
MRARSLSGRPHRSGVPAPGGLLLLALTLFGLFAMHGLQATAGPTDTHAAAVVMTMPGADHPDAETGHHHASAPSHAPSGRHDHPGGQMCLALLVLATLLVLAAAFVGRRDASGAPGRPHGRGHESQGRAPPRPSIFQLSVLRL